MAKTEEKTFDQETAKLAKAVAWRYIRMKNSSYTKVGEEFGISSTKVGKLFNEVLPFVSPFLGQLQGWKKCCNMAANDWSGNKYPKWRSLFRLVFFTIFPFLNR